MNVRLIIAKYRGVCIQCEQPIAKGDAIQYHGRGLGVSCEECAHENDDSHSEDESAGLEPGTLASDRQLARRGLTVVRTSSGWSGTRNARGRCEDAPCCGCCTF